MENYTERVMPYFLLALLMWSSESLVLQPAGIMFTRNRVGFCAACRRGITRIVDLYSK